MAALYVMLHAQFLAVIQVLVYAGGIVVLYLFVVMLVNLKRPPEAHQDRRRRGRLGVVLSRSWCWPSSRRLRSTDTSGRRWRGGKAPCRSQRGALGWLLYTDYLVPFELASMLLLVAMIGAIVLARREL